MTAELLHWEMFDCSKEYQRAELRYDSNPTDACFSSRSFPSQKAVRTHRKITQYALCIWRHCCRDCETKGVL